MQAKFRWIAILIIAIGFAGAVNAAEDNSNRPASTMPSLGVCQPVPNYGPPPPPSEQGEYVIEPILEAKTYFRLYEHSKVEGAASVTILQNPKHGTLDDGGKGSYAYLPESGYLGKDTASILVVIGGHKVKVVYFFQAVDHELGNSGGEELCEKGYHWKISSAPPALTEAAQSCLSSIVRPSPPL